MGTVRVLGERSWGHTGLPLTWKQELLLLLLAGSDRPVRRAIAARLLWPRTSLSSARHSLSQCLYTLRRAELGTLITGDSEHLAWSEEADVDTQQFLRAIRSGNAASAARLYRGPFAVGLKSFHDEFDEWVDRTRGRFHEEARNLFLAYRGRLDIDDSIALAQSLLRHDLLDVEIRLVTMDLLVGKSRESEAVQFHRSSQDAWQSELGEHWPYPAPTRALRIEADSPKSHKFVGREAEMSRLVEIWSSAAGGSMQRALLIGEPGIGKTSVTARFCRLLALRGGASLWASAHPMEKNVPLGVVAQWLKAADSKLDLPLGVRSTRSAVLPPDYEFAAIGRDRLFSEISGQLISSREPLCLVIDDLQWADDISLAFLRYLARHRRDDAVLLLGTVRDNELPKSIVDGIRDFKILTVGPLARDEIADLVSKSIADIRDSDLDGASERLQQRTGGNPLLLAAMLSDGYVGTRSGEEVPSSILEFVHPRLERLSISGRVALASLGILGEATLHSLTAVSRVDDRLEDAIAELSAAGFVEADDEMVRPRHGVIADAALRVIGPAMERQLRGRAARLLQSDGSASPAKLAVHYDLAGQRERAYEAAMRAAGAARELFAFQEAEYFLKVALANASEPAAELLIRFQLADIHLAQGRSGPASQVLATFHSDILDSELKAAWRAYQLIVRLTGAADAAVIEQARDFLSLLPSPIPSDLRARLTMAFASAAHGEGLQEYVHDGIDWTLEMVSAISPGHLRARLGLRVGILVAMYRSAAEGIAMIDSVIDDGSHWQDVLALGYAARGSAKIAAGDSVEAEKDLLMSLELMESTGTHDPKYMITNNLGVLYQEQGRFSEAKEILQVAIESRKEREVPAWAQVALDNLSILTYEMGEWGHAIERADYVVGHFDLGRLSARSWLAQNSIRGLSYLELGRRAAAHECRREIELRYHRSNYFSNDISYVEIFLARCAEMEGRSGEAVLRLEDAIAEFQHRDFFCASRMDVERLRLVSAAEPGVVVDQAPELRRRLTAARARPLVERLDSIVARASAKI